MGTFKSRTSKKIIKIDGTETRVLENRDLESFSPNILGLGDIGQKSRQIDSICACIDLGGFTNFCKQVDPYLVIPDFLNAFLEFIFKKIREETLYKKDNNTFLLWHDLPFFVKFTGDGLIILWNTINMDDASISNIVPSMSNICDEYSRVFFPSLKSNYVDAPKILRCGIARGHVYSVGNGEDYVGACINIESRLQKLIPNVAVSRRGIKLDDGQMQNYGYSIKKVNIRGIGLELIYIKTDMLKILSTEEKTSFEDP